MPVDCHIHMILDGVDWKQAIDRHRGVPDDGFIRRVLSAYRDQGYTYLRDGGDRWGAGSRARELAGEYGITYRTPLSPLCKMGHYGMFIGTGFENLRQYADLVVKTQRAGGDFIKIMISGLMDFHSYRMLTQEGLPLEEIREMIHIAHQEGMAVMAHANGADTVLFAAEAGVDSVEHGGYLHPESLWAMKEAGTVWVPTVSTIGNLLGKGRFPNETVEKILDSTLANIADFRAMGGLLAPGTDAGAWAVPHCSQTEEEWLARAGVEETHLQEGTAVIQRKF
ncbi:MAG: Xaa-Pro dipeptidase [Oscillospiraceae bacterium]|nr:Xaa-Pro dipeptidase [Oscillospiraceae bacterium]